MSRCRFLTENLVNHWCFMQFESNFEPTLRLNRRFHAAIAVFAAFLCALSLARPQESRGASSKQQYFIAERCYIDLQKAPGLQKYRDQWMRCIDKFQDVYRNEPRGPWAAAGLYMSGKLYTELYKRSGKASDKQEAIDSFQRVVKRYPSSSYNAKARSALKEIGGALAPKAPRKQFKPKKSLKHLTMGRVARGPEASEKPRAEEPRPETPPAAPEPAEIPRPAPETGPAFPDKVVTGLRYWSNPSYTRVVVDASDEIVFQHHLLKPDPKLNTPRRLYVDLAGARLGKDVDKTIPINDNLLKDARAGQYRSDTVRVVIDIKTFETYKIFPLKNPFRIVIDVWGEQTVAKASPERLTTPIPGSEKVGPGDLARQFALGVSRIVIDPGHGGKDYGAPGYLKGVHEKYVVLDIAKKLKKMIEKEIGCEVYLTRDSDRFLTLEERTAIANTREADLFISLHTNASTDNRAYGIETYYLNLATDDEAIRVAAMENATSKKNISDLEAILNDLMQNTKIQESTRLASFVQKNLYSHIKRKYKKVRNKGVKQAPFYVLLGARMPAILVETSFISNPTECKRLVEPTYQAHLCEAIVKGVREYIKATTPTALLTNTP